MCVCVFIFRHSGLQWMAKRIVRILLGYDGVQYRRGQDPSQSGGPHTARTVFLGPARNILIV